MSLQPGEAVRRIAIIGTGTIGSGWAAIFAARGYEVKCFVRSSKSEAKFREFLERSWGRLVVRGLASEPDGWKAVRCVSSIAEAVADADYVQESVLEDIGLKQSIIEQIDAIAPPHVLIGSSSSYIPLSLVRVGARRRPERVVTAHPTLPQWDDFVEVMGSCPEHTAWLSDFFGSHVGMDAITLRRENHGHAHNFVLMVLMAACVGTVKTGVTSAAEMDRAVVHMCRTILAAGGISGALVGMVGNGDPQAFIELGTDMCVSGPPAVSACLVSALLPSWLAPVFIALISAWARLLASVGALRRAMGAVTRWYSGDFLALWGSHRDFEGCAARKMKAIAAAE